MKIRFHSRRIFFGWTIVVALGLTTIVSYGTMSYAFGVLLAPIAQEQGWSRASRSAAWSIGLGAAS